MCIALNHRHTFSLLYASASAISVLLTALAMASGGFFVFHSLFYLHLQERDAEIELLRRQLAEFAVKATAPAAAAGAGAEGGIAIAERPGGAEWDIPASWRAAEPSRCSSQTLSQP